MAQGFAARMAAARLAKKSTPSEMAPAKEKKLTGKAQKAAKKR